MSLRCLARRIHEITAVRSMDPTPPTTAEITEGLWSKRNTPSGYFDAIKRSGDVTKGVKREN